MAATFIIDKRQQDAFMRRYTPREVDKVLTKAAAAGARAGVKVIKAAAPVGTSERPSQYYRTNALPHGTLKASVKATKIRAAAVNTIGYRVGPQGKLGFTRAWVEGGTKPHMIGNRQHPGQRANPWFERADDAGLAAAESATRTVIERYGQVT